ncbi:MAG: acyl-[acyl-carrier-protein] thioesterase [Lachnospiraceae bacterium]|nr:acyl-[acyl-carrier-protein] thioesterase [Lachnospiraceae bacterium]
MYSFTTKVRFSEVDVNKILTVNSLINYFQDCSTFHSEDVGLGFSYLNSVNRVWLMISWQVKINRLPGFGEEVEIGTWPYEFKGMYGKRIFTLKEAKTGEMLAYANSIWCYADDKTFVPAKILPENTAGYEMEPPLEMEEMGRKIPLPEGMVEKSAFTVDYAALDCNKHVNNGQYIRMAMDYLPDGFEVGGFMAEYKKMAFLGDTVIPKVASDETSYTVALTSSEGSVYTTVKFFKKQESLK